MASLTRIQVKEIIAKAPPGTTPGGIVAALRAQGHDLEGYGQPALTEIGMSQQPEAAPSTMLQQLNAPMQPATTPGELGNKALELLPTAGGMLGGLAGGAVGTGVAPGVGTFLGATTGAGLGGAAGEGLRQEISALLGREPLTAQGLAGGVAKEGVTQAALETGGRVMASAAKIGGRAAMQVAGKIHLPEVAQTMVQEGIRVTRSGRDRLMKRIGEAGEQTVNMVRQATQGGQRFDGIDIGRKIMQEVGPEVALEPTMARVARRRLVRLNKMFLGSQGRLITPERLHLLKQRADRVAKPIYEAIEAGEIVSPVKQLVARWHRSMADYARAELERAVPGYAAQNARTGQLIRVKEAIWPVVGKSQGMAAQIVKHATRPAVGVAAGATIGASTNPSNRLQGALTGGVAGGLVGNPAVLSHVGLGLNSPLLLQALLHAPRGLVAADVVNR